MYVGLYMIRYVSKECIVINSVLFICRSIVKEQVIQSKQMGRRENKLINFDGRTCFDLYLVVILIRIYILFLYLFR